MEQLLTLYSKTFITTREGFFQVYTKYPHTIPITGCIIYALILLVLPKLCNEKGYKVGFIMVYWNLFLSIFSFMMLLGVGIPYFALINQHGFFIIFCDKKFDIVGSIPSSLLFWSVMFSFSKYMELFDTVLLILKHPTKSVPFLHWYHHFTVLLFTWYSEKYEYSAGLLFILMNTFIHSFMYYYYYLMESGTKPSWSFILTVGQIMQMIFGIIINCTWAYYQYHGNGCSCKNTEFIIGAALIIYGSYLYLFLKFFLGRYFGSGSGEKKKELKKDEKKEKSH